MKNKIKLIALFGKSGAGKDFLLNKILKVCPFDMHRVVSTTTRAPRQGETEGKDYFFVSDKEFTSTKHYEQSYFNGWWYGTGEKNYNPDIVNIGIFDPKRIEMLSQQSDIFDIFSIYVETRDKERLIRALGREVEPNCKEICRRYLADSEDYNFINIQFPYYSFDNNNNCSQFANIAKWVSLTKQIDLFIQKDEDD